MFRISLRDNLELILWKKDAAEEAATVEVVARRSFSTNFLSCGAPSLFSVGPFSDRRKALWSHVLVISRNTSSCRTEIFWLTKRADVFSHLTDTRLPLCPFSDESFLSPTLLSFKFLSLCQIFCRQLDASVVRCAFQLLDSPRRALPASFRNAPVRFQLWSRLRNSPQLSFFFLMPLFLPSSFTLVILGRLPLFPALRGFKLDPRSGGSIRILFFSLHFVLRSQACLDTAGVWGGWTRFDYYCSPLSWNNNNALQIKSNSVVIVVRSIR